MGLDGIDLAMIYCKSLISRSCLFSIENGDDGYGFFNALARSSIKRRAASVEGKNGTGQLCGKTLIVFTTHSEKFWGA